MLEKLRQRSGQTIITILFGMIIVVFVVNFGPQADQTMGCGSKAESTALTVDGHKVGAGSWRYAANGIPAYLQQAVQGMSRADRVALAMDLLIQRELLAQQSERLGFTVNDGFVEDKLKAGKWLFLGKPMPKEYYFYPAPFCQPPAKPKDGMPAAKDITNPDSCEFWGGRWVEGNYDYEKSADTLENMARGFGLNGMDEFVNEQKREWLADMSRSLLIGTANVSREELTAEFEHDKTTATIEFVKFRIPSYQAQVDLDDAKIAAYLAAHEADVKKKYDAESASYEKTKPAVRLRQIFIAKAEEKPPADEPPADKPPADKPVEGKPDDAKQPPDDAVPLPLTAERKKADEVHAQLVAGGDFAALAKKHSQDQVSAKKGGDLGWRRLDRPGLPDKKLTDALATLEPGGKPSTVLETGRGYYILKVDDKREGNLGFDKVKLEIAATLAKEHFAREEARHDADAALAEIKAGKKLSDLFESAPEEPPGGGGGITPEQMEQLRRQLGVPEGMDIQDFLQQRNGADGDTGALIIEGPAVPAAWQPATGAKPPAPAPAQPKPAQPKPAQPKPVPAKPVPPKPAPPKPVPAAGAAKPAPAPAAPATKPAAGAAENRPKPKLQKNGPFLRHPTNVPGVGEAPELVAAIFDELEEGKPATRVYEVGDSLVLLTLVERTGPEDSSFTTEESNLRENATNQKAAHLLGGWLRDRCEQLKAGNDIDYDKSLIKSEDAEGNETPDSYTPCKFF